ncbi:MAG: Ig-like domain-containing protein, partial [Flavobacteriaceae bacterium]|nr:Ig-like domain-containing protein [Flavobacteriaceae bacterium]
GDPTVLGSTSAASGGDGLNYTYLWQSSTDNISFSNIAGAESETYNPPANLTDTTYYKRQVSSFGETIETTSVQVTVNPEIVINSETLTDTSDSEASDGSIVINATGGTGTLEYSKGGSIFQASATFSGLAAGDYTITVRDTNSCEITSSLYTIKVRLNFNTSTPSSGDTDVAIDSDIVLNFDGAVLGTTVNTTNIAITHLVAGNPVLIAGAFSGEDSNQITFDPTGNFNYNEVITVTLTDGLTSLSSGALANPTVITFTTIGEPLNYLSSVPIQGVTAVAIGSDIVLDFDIAVLGTTVNETNIAITHLVEGIPVGISGSFSGEGTNQITFTPTSNFEYNEIITVTYTNALKSLSEGALSNPGAFSFTTVIEPLSFSSSVPTNSAPDVAVTDTIVLTFSTNVLGTTVDVTTILVSGSVSGTIAGTFSGGDTDEITFNPTSSFKYNEIVTVAYTNGLKSLTGGVLSNPGNFSFTTEKQPLIYVGQGLDESDVDRYIGYIELFFDTDVLTSTVDVTTIAVSGSVSGTIPGTFSFSNGSKDVFFNFSTILAYGETVTVTLTSGLTSLEGRALSNPTNFSFTAEIEPLSFSTSVPVDIATNVGITDNIVLNFNTNELGTTVEDNITVIGTVSGSIGGVFTGGDSNQITFNPTDAFEYNEVVTVAFTNLLTSFSGGSLSNPGNFSFTVVTELQPGSIGTAETICYDGTPATLTSATGATNGIGPYSYGWEKSTNGDDFTPISNTNSATYTSSTSHSTDTWYRRSVIDSQPSAETKYTSPVKITVNPTINQGTIDGTQTICYNGDPTLLNSTSVASGGDGLNYSYQWQDSADGINFANIDGETNTTYDPSNLIASRWYRRAAISCEETKYTLAVKVTVNPTLNQGTIDGTQTISYNGNPTVLGSASDASGGNGSYGYQWQSSIDNNGIFGNISGANSATYDPPANLTVTTYYKRQATSCDETKVTTSVQVTVNPILLAGAINGTQAICYNGDPTVLGSTSVASGGNGTHEYQWQSSTDNSDFDTIASATSSTYDPPANLTVTTYYRRQVGSFGETIETTSVQVTVDPEIVINSETLTDTSDSEAS